MAPAVFQFDAEVVYNVLQRFQIEGAASAICRNILTGTVNCQKSMGVFDH